MKDASHSPTPPAIARTAPKRATKFILPTMITCFLQHAAARARQQGETGARKLDAITFFEFSIFVSLGSSICCSRQHLRQPSRPKVMVPDCAARSRPPASPTKKRELRAHERSTLWRELAAKTIFYFLWCQKRLNSSDLRAANGTQPSGGVSLFFCLEISAMFFFYSRQYNRSPPLCYRQRARSTTR